VVNGRGSSNFLRVESGFTTISGYLLPSAATVTTEVTIDGIPHVAHRAEPDYDWSGPEDGMESEKRINAVDRLYLLPLMCCDTNEDYGIDLACLVLTRDNDEVFRRVGTVDVSLLNLVEYYHIQEDRELLVEAIKEQI
jgi:hypothetical protein